MLLSIDWDAYSGTREHVFDSPIWGTQDLPNDRLEAWRQRVLKRGGSGWDALAEDFPLYGGWENLIAYAGLPTYVALSHSDAWSWIEQYSGENLLNVDSHHDLASLSGDPNRLRPGNWVGLGIREGLIRRYMCQYPTWHSNLPVAEGYDLGRSYDELVPLLQESMWEYISLIKDDHLPDPSTVTSVLLVQSPAWTNPAHDEAFLSIAKALQGQIITAPMTRSYQ